MSEQSSEAGETQPEGEAGEIKGLAGETRVEGVAVATVENSSLASVIESDNSHRTASASRFSFHSFTSGSAPRLASVKGDLGLRSRARAFSERSAD